MCLAGLILVGARRHDFRSLKNVAGHAFGLGLDVVRRSAAGAADLGKAGDPACAGGGWVDCSGSFVHLMHSLRPLELPGGELYRGLALVLKLPSAAVVSLFRVGCSRPRRLLRRKYIKESDSACGLTTRPNETS